jgi:hypothetical protein
MSSGADWNGDFFELIRHLPASLQTSFVHIARRQNDGIVDQLGSFSPIVASRQNGFVSDW